LFWNCCYW